MALQLVLYGWMAYMLWVLVTIAVVTVDRGIQNGITAKPHHHRSRHRNHHQVDLVETNSAEHRVSAMYTYMSYYKIRHESVAMLCLLVLGAATTLPWPLVELFHIFRHVRGTKPATAELVSMRLVLQVKLPLSVRLVLQVKYPFPMRLVLQVKVPSPMRLVLQVKVPSPMRLALQVTFPLGMRLV